LNSGEILGVAGLVGAGRSEVVRAIFGIDPACSGAFTINGMPVPIDCPRAAIERGIYLVPEDRRTCGIIGEMSVRENVTLPSLSQHARRGWIRHSYEADAARRACEELRIKVHSIEATAASLSGGNQQKSVLAKWLSLKPQVMLLDEPTRGIDIGAKAEIYRIVRALAERGVAILLVSSDLEEVLGISDRIAVLHEGKLTGILSGNDCTPEAVMRLAVA
jgi:ribose transport system ATP-binding protein